MPKRYAGDVAGMKVYVVADMPLPDLQWVKRKDARLIQRNLVRPQKTPFLRNGVHSLPLDGST